jgi:hypothetical protein
MPWEGVASSKALPTGAKNSTIMDSKKTPTGTLKLMVIGALVAMDVNNIFKTSEAGFCIDDNESIQINGIHQNTNRIKWYGHILRMNTERIPKKVLNTKLNKKSPRQRTRLQWK